MDASGKRRNHINICGNLMLGSRQLPVCGVTVCSTGGVVEQVLVYMVAGHQQQAEPLQSFKRAVGQRQSRATHATAKQPPQMPIVVTEHHDIARSTAQHRRIAYRCVLF